MGDDFRAMREGRRAKHAKNKTENLAAIGASGLVFRAVNNDEALLFRDSGRKPIDFYPSSGTWKLAGSRRIFSGGAAAFIKWYSQGAKQ